jgi:putative flippase GtrA
MLFFVGGLGILYVVNDLFRLPLTIGTALAAEVTTVLRFLVNDHWVFGHERPSWLRLWQFHIASGGGAGIWWVVTNVLPHFGVHYLMASTAGTGCSVMFSMATNFMWIWRRDASAPPVEAVENSWKAHVD